MMEETVCSTSVHLNISTHTQFYTDTMKQVGYFFVLNLLYLSDNTNKPALVIKLTDCGC